MQADRDTLAQISGPQLDLSAMTLASDYARVHAATRPDRVALVFEAARWSYAELDRAADAMVSVLSEAGVQPGDRVAYLGRNSDLFFVAMIGVLRRGAVLVPVNWRNTATETAFVLDDSTAILVLADTEFLPMLGAEGAGARRSLIVDDLGPAGLRALLAAAPLAPAVTPDPTRAALQLYTSGTTGRPKGVMTTQHAFSVQRQAELVCSGFDDWQDDEVLLSPLPSFHIGGMSWVMTGMQRGQTVVVTATTAPGALLDLCLSQGITRTFIVPTLVGALIEEMERRGVRVPSLRGIHYGAASMSPTLLQRSIDTLGCRFLQYYGMTEATGSITLLDPADHDLARPQLLRSVGQALPGVEISIHGPDGRLLRVGEAGEIWTRGACLFTGYWNRPDAYAEAMVDGWYKSGDGGRLDEQGFLYLTDRIKDMIVSGGENVYPAEVEAVLRDHPAVQDCAVFGLPHARWGEGVTAAVELRADMVTDAAALIGFARERLAAYKIPRRIEIGVVLPRTAAGKIKRGELRDRFAASSKSE